MESVYCGRRNYCYALVAGSTILIFVCLLESRLFLHESLERAGILDSVGRKMIEDKCRISYSFYTIRGMVNTDPGDGPSASNQ